MPHFKKEKSEDTGEETVYVYSRAEDRSTWARISALLEKYKPITYLIVALAAAAGFGFRTPMQAFGEIHSEIDTLKQHEKVAEVERRIVVEKLDALSRLKCLESVRTKAMQEARLAGLKCDELIGVQP